MKINVDGHELFLDDKDVGRIPLGRCVVRKNRGTFYVTVGGKFVHRIVLGARKGDVVDHLNGNGLDNRKENLRFCTVGQNRQRAARSKQKSISGYRGVHKHAKKWKADIWFRGTYFYLGTFDDPKEAAKTYDLKARELFGEHAATNF